MFMAQSGVFPAQPSHVPHGFCSLLPLLSTQTPPSLSGEPYRNCRCPAPGSHECITLFCARSVMAFGFTHILFPSFPPQLAAAEDAHLPKRKCGTPGLFQREKIITMSNLTSSISEIIITTCFGAVSSATFTGEFTKAFPFLGDQVLA